MRVLFPTKFTGRSVPRESRTRTHTQISCESESAKSLSGRGAKIQTEVVALKRGIALRHVLPRPNLRALSRFTLASEVICLLHDKLQRVLPRTLPGT